MIDQIRHAYHIDGPSLSMIKREYAYLSEYFASLLVSIDVTKRPLVILIDSIDQLSGENNPYSMRWLPEKLQPNVYVIVSFIPTTHDMLSMCKQRIQDEDRYVEVPILPKDTANSIIKVWLKDANRCVNRLFCWIDTCMCYF